FVKEEVEPLDLVLGDPYDKSNTAALELVKPLQQQVRDKGLWACHLGPELGGPGYGQVKLALLNEILGRSGWAPTIFGCQAPDSGNAEILAHYGTEEQKAKYLQPLLDGEISSCYSMTEPHAGADPTLFTTQAVRDGDEWVINGYKWFSSNARYAEFFIVMVVTNPDVSAYKGMSMFIVPADTPGVNIIRNVGIGTEDEADASHAYMHYDNVRVPADHVLGGEGQAFAIAQTRLGGGRIHHAMRTIARVNQAFDMMCERALARETRDGTLATLQMTQEKIADSWIEIEQFRLLVLRTAWLIDKHNDYLKVRKDISAIKAVMPKVMYDVVQRSMHLHGSLGVSNEMPFSGWMVGAEVMALADGPTESHKVVVARQLLRDYEPHEGLFPNGHLPTRREAARAKFADYLERQAADH
ncbi:MAG: acyl-CoA dehydrogenase family protein, partial [Acidimicrobiales bacterium]